MRGDRRDRIERRSAIHISLITHPHTSVGISSGEAAASAHQWHGAAMVMISSMIVSLVSYHDGGVAAALASPLNHHLQHIACGDTRCARVPLEAKSKYLEDQL